LGVDAENLSGEKPRLTPAEARSRAAPLLAAGWSVITVAKEVGRSERQVYTWLTGPEFAAEVKAARKPVSEVYEDAARRALRLVGVKLDGDDEDVAAANSLRDLVGAASLLGQRANDAAKAAIGLTAEDEVMEPATFRAFVVEALGRDGVLALAEEVRAQTLQ
jgi:hypothetical protein